MPLERVFEDPVEERVLRLPLELLPERPLVPVPEPELPLLGRLTLLESLPVRPLLVVVPVRPLFPDPEPEFSLLGRFTVPESLPVRPLSVVPVRPLSVVPVRPLLELELPLEEVDPGVSPPGLGRTVAPWLSGLGVGVGVALPLLELMLPGVLAPLGWTTVASLWLLYPSGTLCSGW